MKAAITTWENRSAGSLLWLDINEINYRPEGTRIVSKNNAIDGTVITTDWGYPEGNRIIRMRDIMMSRNNFDLLIGMKEDDDPIFHYHYRNSTYQVIIESADGNIEGQNVLTAVRLSVVSKIAEGETS